MRTAVFRVHVVVQHVGTETPGGIEHIRGVIVISGFRHRVLNVERHFGKVAFLPVAIDQLVQEAVGIGRRVAVVAHRRVVVEMAVRVNHYGRAKHRFDRHRRVDLNPRAIRFCLYKQSHIRRVACANHVAHVIDVLAFRHAEAIIRSGRH